MNVINIPVDKREDLDSYVSDFLQQSRFLEFYQNTNDIRYVWFYAISDLSNIPSFEEFNLKLDILDSDVFIPYWALVITRLDNRVEVNVILDGHRLLCIVLNRINRVPIYYFPIIDVPTDLKNADNTLRKIYYDETLVPQIEEVATFIKGNVNKNPINTIIKYIKLL